MECTTRKDGGTKTRLQVLIRRPADPSETASGMNTVFLLLAMAWVSRLNIEKSATGTTTQIQFHGFEIDMQGAYVAPLTSTAIKFTCQNQGRHEQSPRITRSGKPSYQGSVIPSDGRCLNTPRSTANALHDWSRTSANMSVIDVASVGDYATCSGMATRHQAGSKLVEQRAKV